MACAQCEKPKTTIEPKCIQKPQTTIEPKCIQKPNTIVEVNQPKCPHKPNTIIEVCQPKSQHSSFGQKLSEITGKFKGHHARNGINQNQLQCYGQTQVESQGHNGSKTETTRYYGQTQTQKHGISKTQIKVTVVEAEITQTNDKPYNPYGTTTTCFGTHGRKNAELNNKKDVNLLQRIKNGMSRHSNEGGCNSSSSSDSESDNEKCPKTKKRNEQLQTGCK